MPMTQRSALLRTLLLLALARAVTGCAGLKNRFKDKDKNEGLPVATLYDRAHTQMERGNWSNANEVFGRLIDSIPTARSPNRR